MSEMINSPYVLLLLSVDMGAIYLVCYVVYIWLALG